MNKHTALPSLVGFCGAALLLAGCGGSSQKAATLPSTSTSSAATTSSAVATTSTTSTPSASPTSTPSPSSSIPAAVLPADFKIVVDASTPTDPTQQAIWAGWLSFYQAMYQAIGRTNPDDPLYTQWTGLPTNGAPSAKFTTHDFIKRYQDAGITATGTLRLYNRSILGSDGQGTHLSWCEDQTYAYAKVVKTGVVKKTQPSRDDFIYYESYEKQGADGRWLTMWIHSVVGDDRCK